MLDFSGRARRITVAAPRALDQHSTMKMMAAQKASLDSDPQTGMDHSFATVTVCPDIGQ